MHNLQAIYFIACSVPNSKTAFDFNKSRIGAIQTFQTNKLLKYRINLKCSYLKEAIVKEKYEYL